MLNTNNSSRSFNNKLVQYENPIFFNKEFDVAANSGFFAEILNYRKDFSWAKSGTTKIIIHNYSRHYLITSNRRGICRLYKPTSPNRFINYHRPENDEEIKRELINKVIVEVVESFETEMERDIFVKWLSEQKSKENDTTNILQRFHFVSRDGNKALGDYELTYYVIIEELSNNNSGISVYSELLDMMFFKIIDDDIVSSILKEQDRVIRDILTKNQVGSQVDALKLSNDKDAAYFARRFEEARWANALSIYNKFAVENSFPTSSEAPLLSHEDISRVLHKDDNGFVFHIRLIDREQRIDKLFCNVLGEIITIKNSYLNNTSLKDGVYIEYYYGAEEINSEQIYFEGKSIKEILKELETHNIHSSHFDCISLEISKKNDEIRALEKKLEDLRLEEKVAERDHKEKLRQYEEKERLWAANEKEKEWRYKEEERKWNSREKSKERDSDFWKRIFGIAKDILIFAGAVFGFIKLFI